MSSDEYYLDFIRNTKFLKEATKNLYMKKIGIIQNDIWKIKPNDLEYILSHPTIFAQKLEDYALNNKGRTGKTLGQHTKDAYCSAMMALFIYNQSLKETNFELYQKWKQIHENIRGPINEKYKSNEPTERQKQAYVSFDSVVAIRDNLKKGSMERLLLMMYTEIPPVRSEYYKTKIF